MKTTYLIALAVVVIVIIIGSVFAYVYLTKPSTPSKTTTLAAATLTGNGGTLVYPLMETWIAEYGNVEPQISVTYNAVGSGTGITDFITDGLGNFGESDAPLSATQYKAVPSGQTCLTVPITASAVVPAYNLGEGSSTPTLNFTGTILAEIFMGNITNWDDSRLAAINPGVKLPNLPIVCVHRADSSGTMFAFTDFLYDINSAWASVVGPPSTSASIWPKLPGELEGTKNAGVATDIGETTGAIGPLEISYILENPGQTLIYYGKVEDAAGDFILAGDTSISAALAAGATALPGGDGVWTGISIIDNTYKDTSATTIYPIVTMTYALIYEHQSNYDQGAALVNFFSWIVNSGQSLGVSEGYVPLPASIIAIDNTTLKLVSYNGTPIE
ncbi:MAG TPA: phosphate ABC transporter substrate-binding protein PstS [Candidatus Limnocylindrales bacterium]|nr:phosphate ABC transporter substrate-binding protein PstS [Candidatus Limnocylindrales bacterium]